MNKAQLIETFQENLALISDGQIDAVNKQGVSKILDALATTIEEGLEDEGEVTLPGLGKFVAKERAPRTGRNPKTGEPVEIPASVAVTFKPAKALKDYLNP